MSMPEELQRSVGKLRVCATCPKTFKAKNARHKYCPECRKEANRIANKNYYETKGARKRKEARRAARLAKEVVPRKCKTEGCTNRVTGDLKRQYCTQCKREKMIKYHREKRRLASERKASRDTDNS